MRRLSTRLSIGLSLLALLAACAAGGAQPIATPAASQPQPGVTPAAASPILEDPALSATATPAEPLDPSPTSGQSTGAGALKLELVADGLAAPVALAALPDGSGRLLVADQIGVIWLVTPGEGLTEQPFLDLRERMVELSPSYDERGLLGLALHPGYQENGRLYVYYSARPRAEAPEGWDHTSHVAEFTRATGGDDRADPESERVVLQIDQPQPNHNGGGLAFGPDGMLYISLGDGGAGGDSGPGHAPQGNGQDLNTLLGKILRIDVDGGEPYGIPEDNPFAGGGGQPEIYAYGLRNPYRISFDLAGERQLFAGDVGQGEIEEVDMIEAGGNYGWKIMEGRHCYQGARCEESGAQGDPLRMPIVEYGHDQGVSVIGGYVYRGSALPQLAGSYIFGDWSAGWEQPGGRLMQATAAGGAWELRSLPLEDSAEGALGYYLLGFGQDAAGEIYILASSSQGPRQGAGKIFRLAPA